MFKDTKILRAILAVLILFIPLYPKFPLTSVTNTYVAIRLDDIIVATAIAILLIYQIKNRFAFLKYDVTKLFLAYFASITVINIISYLINQTDPANILLLHLFRRFQYMSLFFLTISSLYQPKDIKYPFVTVVVATLLASVYGYGQRYLNFPVISTMNEEFSKGQLLTMSVWTRISSTFAGHYDYASFLSVVLVLLGGVAVTRNKPWQKILLLLVWLIAFHQLTYTASRVSIFSFWGGLILCLVLLRKYLWIVPLTLVVVYSIIGSKDLNQRLLATIPSLKYQFNLGQSTPAATPTPPTPTPTAIATPTKKPSGPKLSPTPTVIRHERPEDFPPPDVDAGVARSGEIRFNVEWPRAINALKKNPLIGTGLGSLTLATDNDYLRALGESGIVGFLTFFFIFVWFYFKSFRHLWIKNKNWLQQILTIIFAATLTQLANAVFIDVFEASKTAYLFWILMGVYYMTLKFLADDDKK